MEFKETEIGPDLAKSLLATTKVNRKIKSAVVKQYADAMRRGVWSLTSQGIVIDSEGTLIDGQHRLTAIVLTGITVPMLITSGVPKESQQVLDGGSKRSVSDNLSMYDGLKKPKFVVAVARTIRALNVGYMEKSALDTTRETIAEYSGGIEWFQSLSMGMAPQHAQIMAALIWVRKHGWRNDIDTFFAQLSTRVGLTLNSPVSALAMYVTNPKNMVGQDRKMWTALVTLNALNAHCQGKPSRTLRRSTVGFDHFQWLLLKSFNLGEGHCAWHRRCSLIPRTGKMCWIHSTSK